MNKDNAKLFLPLVQALAEGKTLQVRTQTKWSGGEEVWTDMTEMEIKFFSEPDDYRVKPTPTKEATEYFIVEFVPRDKGHNEWKLWHTYTNREAARSAAVSIIKNGRMARYRRFISEKVA